MYRLLIIFTLLVVLACSREEKFIQVLNSHDTKSLMEMVDDNFKWNNQSYEGINFHYTMEDSKIGGIKYSLDSINRIGDSSILYTHWTSYLQQTYGVKPFETKILLKYKKGKIEEAHFINIEPDWQQKEKYNKQAEQYLWWLHNKYPEIYNRMDSISASALDSDSSYLEYSRLLHLKINEYHPD